MLGNKANKQYYRSGGTRGGQDQFKWDDVKTDKHRENYLGHSVSAPVGRWQKGKDLTWYAKSKSAQEMALEEERRKIRDLDEDLVNEALGIRGVKRKFQEEQTMDNADMKRLLTKGSDGRGEELEEDAKLERIKGLGGGITKFHDHIERKSYLEKEIEKLKNNTTSGSSNSGSSTNNNNNSDEYNELRKKLGSRVIPLTVDNNNNNSSSSTSATMIAGREVRRPTASYGPQREDIRVKEEEEEENESRHSKRSDHSDDDSVDGSRHHKKKKDKEKKHHHKKHHSKDKHKHRDKDKEREKGDDDDYERRKEAKKEKKRERDNDNSNDSRRYRS